jgi:hypothetical protein
MGVILAAASLIYVGRLIAQPAPALAPTGIISEAAAIQPQPPDSLRHSRQKGD